MSFLGRNFDFLVSPRSGQRAARFVLTGDAAVPIGAPVVYDSVSDAPVFGTGAQNVELATGAQAPQPGLSGILVYEYANAAFAGDDEVLTNYSDKDTAPVGDLVQVVSGDSVKVRFKNLAERTFLVNRTYAARKMVAGIGQATPTVTVGEYLTPGVGDDTDGYWAVTADVANAWLVVTAVDNTRAEVEARMMF